MNRFHGHLVAAAAVIGLGGTALAADTYRPPIATPKPVVVVPQAYNWNGWYVGVQGGWDTNRAASPGYVSTENGGIAGAYTGVNFTLGGNLVAGIDASINWDGANATTTVPDCVCTFEAGPNWKAFIRGRVGVAMDRALLYATAGGAAMGYSASVVGAGSGSAVPWGWTAGAGIDWALTNNLIARFDWAYQDYGAFTLQSGAPLPNLSGVPVAATSNTFLFGLALKL